VHDGCCARCGRDELLDDDELCPRCYAIEKRDDFDADELGLDPEEEYDA